MPRRAAPGLASRARSETHCHACGLLPWGSAWAFGPLWLESPPRPAVAWGLFPGRAGAVRGRLGLRLGGLARPCRRKAGAARAAAWVNFLSQPTSVRRSLGDSHARAGARLAARFTGHMCEHGAWWLQHITPCLGMWPPSLERTSLRRTACAGLAFLAGALAPSALRRPPRRRRTTNARLQRLLRQQGGGRGPGPQRPAANRRARLCLRSMLAGGLLAP